VFLSFRGGVLDNKEIRSDFPLAQKVIYLDSAATSLTPISVVEGVAEYYREYNANTGRGVHHLSQIAGAKYLAARRKIATLIGGKEEEIIFTQSATYAINTVAQGISLQPGDHIVTTNLEHHSNFLPWLRLRERGVEVTVVKASPTGHLELDDFQGAIDERTKLVAVAHVSNVLGTITPISDLSALCHEKGALLLVDGAQSVPHMPVDVERLGCDFLCFSGHKMLGPTGTGVLWVREDLLSQLSPLVVGGGAIEDVSMDEYVLAPGYTGFEAGTPNIAGVIGLGRAVDYLNALGMEWVEEHEARLTEQLLNGLEHIKRVKIVGEKGARGRIGVVPFVVEGMHPHDVALLLDEAAGILVRSGHQCALPLMKELGLKDGVVRVSLYLYSTQEEVEILLITLNKALSRT